MDRPDVVVFQPTKWADLSELYNWLSSENHDRQTVIIDSITEAQRLGLDQIMQTSKTPDLPGIGDYGKSNEQMVRAIRAFRGLASSKGMHVIFTALEAEDKDAGSGAVLVRPALTPKASAGICGAVDAVGYLTVKEDARVLILQQTDYIMAKFRQPLGSSAVPAQIKNPDLTRIIRAMQGVHKEESQPKPQPAK
jgi:AAA domain